jgi:hypothetical protein
MRCYYIGCEGWDEDTGCTHDPWRALTAEDLTTLPKDTPVRIRGEESGTIGDKLDLYLPGHYPFLLGMQAFWSIEVPDERFVKETT